MEPNLAALFAQPALPPNVMLPDTQVPNPTVQPDKLKELMAQALMTQRQAPTDDQRNNLMLQIGLGLMGPRAAGESPVNLASRAISGGMTHMRTDQNEIMARQVQAAQLAQNATKDDTTRAKAGMDALKTAADTSNTQATTGQTVATTNAINQKLPKELAVLEATVTSARTKDDLAKAETALTQAKTGSWNAEVRAKLADIESQIAYRKALEERATSETDTTRQTMKVDHDWANNRMVATRTDNKTGRIETITSYLPLSEPLAKEAAKEQIQALKKQYSSWVPGHWGDFATKLEELTGTKDESQALVNLTAKLKAGQTNRTVSSEGFGGTSKAPKAPTTAPATGSLQDQLKVTPEEQAFRDAGARNMVAANAAGGANTDVAALKTDLADIKAALKDKGLTPETKKYLQRALDLKSVELKAATSGTAVTADAEAPSGERPIPMPTPTVTQQPEDGNAILARLRGGRAADAAQPQPNATTTDTPTGMPMMQRETVAAALDKGMAGVQAEMQQVTARISTNPALAQQLMPQIQALNQKYAQMAAMKQKIGQP